MMIVLSQTCSDYSVIDISNGHLRMRPLEFTSLFVECFWRSINFYM